MAKIAISMPDSTLKAVEEARRRTGETRSEFLRRAAEAMMREDQLRQRIERYVEGYRRMPETLEDTLYSEELSELIAQENPWEPEGPSVAMVRSGGDGSRGGE